MVIERGFRPDLPAQGGVRLPSRLPNEADPSYVGSMKWSLGRRARTRRGEIAWDCLGEGPPVVLTHGTPSRSLVWREIAPKLAETHEVYVWDLRPP